MNDRTTPAGPRPIDRFAPAAGTRSTAPKGRPNATPMRVALGTGFLAALSAIVGTIVAPPGPPVAAADPNLAAAGAAATPGSVIRPIVYVQLKPGETAPPGATVIDPAAPTPMTVVTTITAPVKPVIIKTTQSGKVVP